LGEMKEEEGKEDEAEREEGSAELGQWVDVLKGRVVDWKDGGRVQSVC
jgi:hypothetical protein